MSETSEEKHLIQFARKLFVITAATAALGGSLNAQTYTVVDLGAISGPTNPKDINDSRQICGVDGARPFYWENGTIGTLAPLSANLLAGSANGINASGVVVGRSKFVAPNQAFPGPGDRSTKWDTLGVPSDLGTLRVNTTPFFGDLDSANAISDSGVIVGHAQSDTQSFAYRWDNGTMTSLGSLGANFGSSANSINANGTIVGWSLYGFGIKQAVRWTGSSILPLGFSAGQNQSIANAINDSDVTVGYSYTQNSNFTNKYATRWEANGGIVDLSLFLPPGQSWANDINNDGVTVGTMGIPVDNHSAGFAFLYDPDGCGLVDLNTYLPNSGTLFTTLSESTAINDNGDIVGWGLLPDLSTHAFLLVKNTAGAGAVTEPCGATTQVDLIAGQHYTVGSICVANDGNTLCVEYKLNAGQCMTESHLEIALTLADIPQTKSGNPKVGKFTYSTNHSPPTSEFSYCISLDELGFAPGSELVIAAHAAMCSGETGWGEGPGFSGNNWAMYLGHTVGECCPEDAAAASTHRTESQGTWGAPCPDSAAACELAANFDALYPFGLVVGTWNSVVLTSSAAVRDVLPASGAAAALSTSYVNPTLADPEDPNGQATEAGAFLGNVVALELNVRADASLPYFGHPYVRLANMLLVDGPCAGMTVLAVLDEANRVLGGEPGTLGQSAADLNAVCRAINDTFLDPAVPGVLLIKP